jgi:hypothetical protein
MDSGSTEKHLSSLQFLQFSRTDPQKSPEVYPIRENVSRAVFVN